MKWCCISAVFVCSITGVSQGPGYRWPLLTLVVGLLAAPLALAAGANEQTKHALRLRVIHAHSADTEVDASLKSLVRDLKALRFTGYRLKDEAVFKLALKSNGRLQLPTGDWMTVMVDTITQDGRLRITLAVKNLDFKVTANIAAKARVVIPGPTYEGGRLVLAVERATPAAKK